MCASALLNAAIIVVRTSQDYARAKALAERSLALLPADSSDVASAQMVISHCNDPDRDSTRLAPPPAGTTLRPWRQVHCRGYNIVAARCTR